ncbi:FHA domain-containing protein, partial [Bacteroides sp. OttesenSCG-928-N06]|nr:FHA domain-containing protein [Bacteroides sp. OttesenSCG-928-N06]
MIQKDISVTSVAASDKTVRVHREIKLYLVNYPLGIRLEASNNAIIGRRQGPYISVLNSQPYISSKHAVLKCDMGAEWSITDLGSSNGTFLDRVKLVPDIPYQLKPGMKVQLANVELV